MGYVINTLAFYYCCHSYRLGEAGGPDSLYFDIAYGGPAATQVERASVNINFCISVIHIFHESMQISVFRYISVFYCCRFLLC